MSDMAITVHTRHGHVAVTGGRIRYRVVGDHDATPLATVLGGPRPTHDNFEPSKALEDHRPAVCFDGTKAALNVAGVQDR